jgi:hypothetical protein
MKKKPKERTLVRPLLWIMLLSLLEPVLIIAGFLPPIFSYSLGNILFMLAGFAVVAYVAYTRANEGLKASILNGLALGFTSVSIICASGLVGSVFYDKPVIGISTGSQQSRLLVLVTLIIQSTIVVALFSVLVTWLTKKFYLKETKPAKIRSRKRA